MAQVEEPDYKGKVEKVRKEWAVYEDGALAHRLQEEEIGTHYSGNIQRRQTVRKDIETAKVVAGDEALEAFEAEQEIARRQLEIEEMDRQAAEQLYQQLLEEERSVYERQKSQEDADAEYARHLQQKEQRKFERHQLKKRERELRREREQLERLMAEQDRGYGQKGGVYDEDDMTNAVAAMRVDKPRKSDYPPDQLPPEGYDEDFVQNNADKRLSDDIPGYEVGDEDVVDQETRQNRQLQDDEEFARLLEEQERKRKNKHKPKDISELTARDEEIARKMQQEEELMARRHQYKKHQKKVSGEIADLDPLVPLRADHPRQQSVPAKIKYGEGGITLTSYKQSEEVTRDKRHSLPVGSQPPGAHNHHSSQSGHRSSSSSFTSPSQTIDIAATLDPTYRPDSSSGDVPSYQPPDVEGITLLKKTPLNESLPPAMVDEMDGYPETEADPNAGPIQGTRRKSDSKKEKKNSKGLFGKLKKKK